jgi:hypothetical protein
MWVDFYWGRRHKRQSEWDRSKSWIWEKLWTKWIWIFHLLMVEIVINIVLEEAKVWCWVSLVTLRVKIHLMKGWKLFRNSLSLYNRVLKTCKINKSDTKMSKLDKWWFRISLHLDRIMDRIVLNLFKSSKILVLKKIAAEQHLEIEEIWDISTWLH